MKQQNKKKVLLIGGIAIAIIAVLVGVWFFTTQSSIITGEKNIKVMVVYADQSQDMFDIKTKEEFLRGALEQEKLISGNESQYGLFVTTVNGVTADDSKQEWWQFSSSGSALPTSVDSTPIADGQQFEILLTVGYE